MTLRIGLDVDGVLANFPDSIIRYAHASGRTHWPSSHEEVATWSMSHDFREVFNEVCYEPSFWLNLEPLLQKPDFVPYMYLTARPIGSEVTVEWLKQNGFPDAPVMTVSNPDEKLAILTDHKINIFVDDYYKTITEINTTNSPTIGLLYKAPYQVGHAEELANLEIVSSLKSVDLVNSAIMQLRHKLGWSY